MGFCCSWMGAAYGLFSWLFRVHRPKPVHRHLQTFFSFEKSIPTLWDVLQVFTIWMSPYLSLLSTVISKSRLQTGSTGTEGGGNGHFEEMAPPIKKNQMISFSCRIWMNHSGKSVSLAQRDPVHVYTPKGEKNSRFAFSAQVSLPSFARTSREPWKQTYPA